jgi:hypothetical protein
MIPYHYFTPERRQAAANRRQSKAGAALLCGVICLSCFALASVPARAWAAAQGSQQGQAPQGGQASPSAQSGQAGPTPDATLSKATLQLYDDLDDIDRLRSLGPMKFTADQLDKIIAVFTAAKEGYDKALTDLLTTQVKELAAEIKEVKRKMLLGEPIPAAFDAKSQKASADFITAREKLDNDFQAKIADKLREIFTPAQVAEAVKMSKASPAAANLKKDVADSLWFNFYLKKVLIDYARILPLLKEMRGAVGGDAKTAKLN